MYVSKRHKLQEEEEEEEEERVLSEILRGKPTRCRVTPDGQRSWVGGGTPPRENCGGENFNQEEESSLIKHLMTHARLAVAWSRNGSPLPTSPPGVARGGEGGESSIKDLATRRGALIDIYIRF